MKRRLSILLLAALAALLAASILATRADSNVTITLPPPNDTLKDGPNVALAQTKCLICHSADYIYMQPPLTRKQWTAEVTKMQKTFGAPIADADVPPLVDYLMSQNGKPD
ncbi:MAG TPA: hypothetical protein VIX35_04470 [Vicinamibacterales bacterium]